MTWEGTVESALAGEHKFQLYGSSYFKVFVDEKLALDRWRQNWAAWYHNFDVFMDAGKPVKIRIEWIPQDGYIALLHNDPLPDAERRSLTFTSETGRAVDYYVRAGGSQDEVIAGYRQLTGKAVLLPRWAYGFWQSRQRYTTQAELLGVVDEYRKRKIPLDNIVLDWFYWKEDAWGSHEFDRPRFPDPKGMIDKVHARNAQPHDLGVAEVLSGHRQLQGTGRGRLHVHRQHRGGRVDWVGPGYTSSFYDPYSKPARDMYWRQVNEKLGVLGVDAWWMDATEPDLHSNLDIDSIKARMGPTAMGPADQYFNTYPLVHSGGVYEGARAARPDKRVFILTRSGFAGIQRNAAARMERRHRLALGRSVQPDFRGREHRLFRSAELDFRHRRIRQRGALQHAEPRSPRISRNGASSTCAGSSSARSRRCSGRTANFRCARSTTSPRKAPRSTKALYGTTSCATGCCRTSTRIAADTCHRDGTIMRGLAMDFTG